MTTSVDQSTVLLSEQDGIATLTFNRPEQMNTFNDQMSRDLEKVTEELSRKKDLKVLCLKGAGRLFMAGGDISYFHQNLDQMPEGILSMVRQAHASILNLNQLECPIIAAVHGSVAGIGLSFLALADLAIAGQNTRFGTAYGNIGLTPDGGSTYFLPRLLGPKKAMEITLLPDLFNAQQALEWGLLNWVVPEEDLDAQCSKVLQRLALGPLQAIRRSKALIKGSLDQSLASQLEAEAQCFTASTGTRDFRRGVEGFLQKKAPQFDGS